MLAVVIILGVLIVLALGALVGGAIMRGRQPAASQGANAGATTGAGAESGAAAYAARLAAPGERLESASTDQGRIVLRFSGGATGGELVVLDAATGRVIGRIAVDSGP